MPRPPKCRKVCCLPKYGSFAPMQGVSDPNNAVTLSVDEFEAIRLIDYEGLSQEACSVYMNVARTTVQQIYNVARKKLASALVNGASLHIEGGCYRLCDGQETCCGCGGFYCHNRRGPGEEPENSK